MKVADIPASMGGLLRFNVMNAMFAIALADAQSLPGEAIRTALASFANTREKSPGRYNMIDGFACPVLIDYAHNDPAVAELCRVVRALPVTGRRFLVLQILGNSGPHKLENNAVHLLESFDRIAVLPDLRVIRKYGYFTGDDPEEEMRQLSQATLIARGASSEQLLIGPDTEVLVDQVMQSARPDDLVVLMMAPQDAFGHVDRLLGPQNAGE
jgi:UDP-N-acetylmuramyl tripeptide synthase